LSFLTGPYVYFHSSPHSRYWSVDPSISQLHPNFHESRNKPHSAICPVTNSVHEAEKVLMTVSELKIGWE
jgi:hypothetical protein